MQTTTTPEVLSQWNGEVSTEIREQYGIFIDRSEQLAGVWINVERLRTPEDLMTALEIGNGLKALLVDKVNRRVSSAGTGTLAT